jgi:shikimate kinase
MVTGLPLTERNLILTGYIEPNKPRVGRQVADALNMPFVDVEQQIEERFGTDMQSIREQFGMRRLKTVEAELMDEAVLRRNTVLRINGSTLMHSDHFERIAQTGPVICLVARLDAILQRLHLMMGARYHDPAERGAALSHLQREWAVRKFETLYELDATDKKEPDIVQDTVALWREVAIERI